MDMQIYNVLVSFNSAITKQLMVRNCIGGSQTSAYFDIKEYGGGGGSKMLLIFSLSTSINKAS